MSVTTLQQFSVFINRYYWHTAVLIARNSLARLYRNSFLGILWTVLQPLTMVMVYATVMPMIARFPSTGNYPLYIIVSLPTWGFISTSLTTSSHSLLSNGPTIMRCMVSSTVFPVADMLRNTYTFFVSFVTMYVMALLLGIASLHPALLLLPLYCIPLVMTLGALSIAIAFIAPYLRDIGDLIGVMMTVLFWLTPVVYPLTALTPRAQALMQWNPLYIMVHPVQMIAFDYVLPGPADMLPLLALTLLSIGFGFFIYRLCRRNYVYYL
jgi:lipopolysaccharide transport system permease protein